MQNIRNTKGDRELLWVGGIGAAVVAGIGQDRAVGSGGNEDATREYGRRLGRRDGWGR